MGPILRPIHIGQNNSNQIAHLDLMWKVIGNINAVKIRDLFFSMQIVFDFFLTADSIQNWNKIDIHQKMCLLELLSLLEGWPMLGM